MKRITMSLLIVGIIVSLGIIGSRHFNEDKNLNSDKTLISYYVETGEGTGVYEKQEGATWPEGYVLNEEKSTCDNGSTLSWDSSTNSVVVTASKEDSCKVYLDKKIELISFSITHRYGLMNSNVVEYYAEKNSTFKDWANSDYNKSDLFVSGDIISNPDGYHLKHIYGDVYINDVVKENGSYCVGLGCITEQPGEGESY